MIDIADLAKIVDEAAATATAIPQLSQRYPDLSIETAYAIQASSLARRRARGERRVGYKMGLTSRAKMQQVGVNEVIWGRLTDRMRLSEGGELHRSRYVHPRVEPEIAFVMGKRLKGEVSAAEAMLAVAAIAPALEIIDSRYENFKFALADVIADNSSSSGFSLGGFNPVSVDVGNVGILMEVNGQPVQIGSSAAILGHPVRALIAAARAVAQAGEALEPGDIVLAGAATAAHALQVGDHVCTRFQGLGAIEFSVSD